MLCTDLRAQCTPATANQNTKNRGDYSETEGKRDIYTSPYCTSGAYTEHFFSSQGEEKKSLPAPERAVHTAKGGPNANNENHGGNEKHAIEQPPLLYVGRHMQGIFFPRLRGWKKVPPSARTYSV